MKIILRPMLVTFLALTLLTGVFYPLLTTAIAQAIFPAQAAGNLLERDGHPVGASLIGQNFSAPGHFWGRPSATSPQPNNGLASGGSNLGPLNPALTEAVKGRVDALHAADPDNTSPVPVDLVTASASGLDPHISLAAAQYQLARVARAQHMPVETVQALIDRATQRPAIGVLGDPVINVLQLNIALDSMQKPR